MFYVKLNLSNDEELEVLYKNYDEARRELVDYFNRENIEIITIEKNKELSAATNNSDI